MVDLGKSIIQEGLKAAARATGEGNPTGALKAATTAVAATRIVGNLTNKARQAADALRDRVEGPSDRSTDAEPPAAPQDPIDALGAELQARPEASGIRSLFESARAAYRADRIAAGADPNGLDEAVAKVRGTLPAIMDKTGALVEKAAPPGADGFKRLARGLSKKLSGSDIAAEIGRVDTWKGMVAGTGKLGYLGILLGRMGTPDVGVFQALDAFSNHNTERNKALTKIMDHCSTLRVDAETAIETINGFRLTNGKPDYAERKIALRTLATNIPRSAVPAVVEGYSDDDKQRLDAVRVIADICPTFTAAEIVEVLKLFGTKHRAGARFILEPKLTDRDNVALLDDLFAPKKTLADFKEIQAAKAAVGGAFGELWSGFTKGRNQ